MRLMAWLARMRTWSSPVARRQTRARFRPNVEWLECRRVPATLLVSPTGCFNTTTTPYLTIQSAVDAAAAGDTIVVSPGTYQEQVLLTKDGLDLESATPGTAVIQAPQNDTLLGNEAIVEIQGATNVTVDGFTITGPGPSLTDGLAFGVYVDGGGSATLSNNDVTRISDDGTFGSRTGTGIQIGLSPAAAGPLGLAPATGSALILNNTVDNYQVNGIVVDGAGSSATVQGNTVFGTPSSEVMQHGIEVSNGALGVVQGNMVKRNLFTQDRGSESAGILLSSPGDRVQVLGNTLFFNDAGIVVQGAVNAVLSGNTLDENLFDGIQLTAGTTGAQVTSNECLFNGLDGIYVAADGNLIAGNSTHDNAEDGIQVLQSSGNRVQGNSACHNARYGISLFLSDGQSNAVDGNTVSGNRIKDFFP